MYTLVLQLLQVITQINSKLNLLMDYVVTLYIKTQMMMLL